MTYNYQGDPEYGFDPHDAEPEWVPCGRGPCWAEEGHEGPCMPDDDDDPEPTG